MVLMVWLRCCGAALVVYRAEDGKWYGRGMASYRCVVGCFGLVVERVEDERDLQAAVEVAGG
jgi:hypothetical protein